MTTNSTRAEVTVDHVQPVVDNPRLLLVRWEDGTLEHLTEGEVAGHPHLVKTVTDEDGVTGRVLLTGTHHGVEYGDHDENSATYAADLAETINAMEQ
jgi:hypothetical protein